MFKYAITQSGPAIGQDEQSRCYMAGLQNTPEHTGEYLGDSDTLDGAMDLIIAHVSWHRPFTVEYIPWKE